MFCCEIGCPIELLQDSLQIPMNSMLQEVPNAHSAVNINAFPPRNIFVNCYQYIVDVKVDECTKAQDVFLCRKGKGKMPKMQSRQNKKYYKAPREYNKIVVFDWAKRTFTTSASIQLKLKTQEQAM